MYRQDQTKVLRLNTVIPGSPAITELTPLVSAGNPVNMAGVQGIFNARGRLGLWDITNSIYWSSLDDPEDFNPTPETGANIVKVDGLIGRIVDIQSTDDGFVVYTTGNIMFAQWDQDQIFTFHELTSSVGIFTPDHLCVGNNGEHIIYGNGDFYIVNARRDPGKPLIQNIFPEVGDYIKKYKGYPRLSFHGNRYFAIALNELDTDANTIIERSRVELPGWYDPGYVSQWKNIFLGWGYNFWLSEEPPPALTEEYVNGESFADACPTLTIQTPQSPIYHPIEYPPEITTGDIPHRGYKGKLLWFMQMERRPGIDLETIEDEDYQILVQNSANVNEMIYSNAEFNAIGVTADTFAAYNEFWNGSNWDFEDPKFTFSFHPFKLLQIQLELYKERTQLFFDGAANFGDYFESREGYVYTIVSKDTGIQTTVLSAATGEDMTYTTSVTEDEDDLIVINIRERDKGVNRVRETFQWELTRKIERLLVASTTENDWQAADPLTSNNHGNAMQALSGVVDNIMVVDNNLKSAAVINSSEYLRFKVGELGNDYPFTESNAVNPNTDKELFGTQCNIAGKTDNTNYATIASFAGRRAFVTDLDIDTTNESAFELKELDPANEDFGFYYVKSRSTRTHTRTFDRLVLEAGNPSPDGYSDLGLTQVPRRNFNAAFPIWFIYNEAGDDPELLLEQYWSEALLNYSSMEDYLAIKQVYEDHGWIVEQHVPTVNVTEEHFEMPVAEASPDTLNGVPNSGVFGSIDLLGEICNEPMSEVPVVNLDDAVVELLGNTSIVGVIPTVEVESGFSTDEWTGQGTQLVELTGQAGVLVAYPIYDNTLWFDWYLQKWGICNAPVRFNMDYRPLNRIAYDPMSGESKSEYTYSNYLKSLGAVGVLGEMIAWDRNPNWSFCVFGKIGFKRRNQTRMVEATFEFLDKPNCIVGIEAALDESGINPFTTQAKYAKKKFERLECDSVGPYHNVFVFGGRYEIIQIEYIGHDAGDY